MTKWILIVVAIVLMILAISRGVGGTDRSGAPAWPVTLSPPPGLTPYEDLVAAGKFEIVVPGDRTAIRSSLGRHLIRRVVDARLASIIVDRETSAEFVCVLGPRHLPSDIVLDVLLRIPEMLRPALDSLSTIDVLYVSRREWGFLRTPTENGISVVDRPLTEGEIARESRGLGRSEAQMYCWSRNWDLPTCVEWSWLSACDTDVDKFGVPRGEVSNSSIWGLHATFGSLAEWTRSSMADLSKSMDGGFHFDSMLADHGTLLGGYGSINGSGPSSALVIPATVDSSTYYIGFRPLMRVARD